MEKYKHLDIALKLIEYISELFFSFYYNFTFFPSYAV